MQTQHQKPPALNVGSILPSDWNRETDVLLIVGEGASALAQPFIAYGLKRVIIMFPRPLRPEPAPPGCTVVSSRGELNRTLQMIGHDAANRFALLRTPDCSLSQAETETIHGITATLLKRKRANNHTHQELAPLWAANGLRNLSHLGEHPMVTDLKGQFDGVPLIIVGAGPSLSKNIEHLRAAQGKAIIICVARALSSLQNAGVWPDFAISLDAYDVKSHFRDIALDRIPGVILSATSHPNLLDLNDTTLISFSANTEAEGWMFEPADGVIEMASGGSVSCAAMSVGLHWGCNPIMVIGQDLSFGGGQFYHGNGTDGDTQAHYDESTNTWTLDGYSDDLAHTLKDQINDGGLKFSGTEVPGYFGGTVPTNSAFASFRTWFELTALDEAGRTTMLNCTEGGAHIGGMKHIPLSVAIQHLPQRTIDVRTILDKPGSAYDTDARVRRMIEKRQTVTSNLSSTIKYAQQAVELIGKAKRKPSALTKLQAVEAKLSAAMKNAFVISLLAQEDIRTAIAQGQSATCLADSLDASAQLYQAVIDHAERLQSSVAEQL